MKYLLTGESTAHSSLEDLVCYHGQVRVNNNDWGENIYYKCLHRTKSKALGIS